MLSVTRLSDYISLLLVNGVLLLLLSEDELVVMRVSELCVEGIINDFGVCIGDLLGRMEVLEILGVLVLEGRNSELENILHLLDVVPGPP